MCSLLQNDAAVDLGPYSSPVDPLWHKPSTPSPRAPAPLRAAQVTRGPSPSRGR